MTRKVLAQTKVRIGGTDKGVEVVATRNKVGNYVYYRLAYYPATVKVDELSTGVQYEVFSFKPGTAPVTVWNEQTVKSTPKLNGFYEGLVDFIANEFASGLRTI